MKKIDKSNINYCRDLGIKTIRVDDLKDQYFDFYNFIIETAKYYDQEEQRKVQNVLEKYKSYF